MRWLEFGNSELWIGQPGNEANVVCAQLMQRRESIVVHGGATAKGRVLDDLECRCGFGDPLDLVPMDRELKRLILGSHA